MQLNSEQLSNNTIVLKLKSDCMATSLAIKNNRNLIEFDSISAFIDLYSFKKDTRVVSKILIFFSKIHFQIRTCVLNLINNLRITWFGNESNQSGSNTSRSTLSPETQNSFSFLIVIQLFHYHFFFFCPFYLFFFQVAAFCLG